LRIPRRSDNLRILPTQINRGTTPISESLSMRERLMILGVVWLKLSLPLIPTTVRAQDTPVAEDQHPDKKHESKKTQLRMTPGIVCSAIDGYENYKVLPKAAQTSDEKLLVYFRPMGFQTEMVDGAYEAHLVPGFEIRKRGQKEVLLQKPRMYEYKPRQEQPPRYIYMKNAISLKGLPPGDYDLTVILRDEIAKGPPAKQVVKFRVIPADDPEKQEKGSQSDDKPADR
jgi:hypothetical protein